MSRLSRIAIFAFGSAFLSFAVGVGLLSLMILNNGEDRDQYWTLWDSVGFSRWHFCLPVSVGMLIGGAVSTSFGSSLPRFLRSIQLTTLTLVVALPIALLVEVLSKSGPLWHPFFAWFVWGLGPALYSLPLFLSWSVVYAIIERRA